jgi:hypothetical protein
MELLYPKIICVGLDIEYWKYHEDSGFVTPLLIACCINFRNSAIYFGPKHCYHVLKPFSINVNKLLPSSSFFSSHLVCCSIFAHSMEKGIGTIKIGSSTWRSCFFAFIFPLPHIVLVKGLIKLFSGLPCFRVFPDYKTLSPEIYQKANIDKILASTVEIELDKKDWKRILRREEERYGEKHDELTGDSDIRLLAASSSKRTLTVRIKRLVLGKLLLRKKEKKQKKLWD